MAVRPSHSWAVAEGGATVVVPAAATKVLVVPRGCCQLWHDPEETLSALAADGTPVLNASRSTALRSSWTWQTLTLPQRAPAQPLSKACVVSLLDAVAWKMASLDAAGPTTHPGGAPSSRTSRPVDLALAVFWWALVPTWVSMAALLASACTHYSRCNRCNHCTRHTYYTLGARCTRRTCCIRCTG